MGWGFLRRPSELSVKEAYKRLKAEDETLRAKYIAVVDKYAAAADKILEYQENKARLRVALKRIAKEDVHTALRLTHFDPSGSDYAEEEFPGPFGLIAMEALKE